LLAVVVVGIPAGLAVLAGAYWLIRGPGLEVLLSFVVGLVLLIGLNAMWERRYGGRPLALVAMAFGVVMSGAYQIVAQTGLQAIGLSWVTLIASVFGLAVLFLPGVRIYFETPPRARS